MIDFIQSCALKKLYRGKLKKTKRDAKNEN